MHCFHDELTQLEKILHDRRLRRSWQISSLCVLWAAIAIKKAKCLHLFSLIRIPICYSSRFTIVYFQIHSSIYMLCVECSECDNEGKTSFFVRKLTNSLDPSSPIDISTTVLYFRRLLPSDGEQIFIRTRFSSLNNNLNVS